MAFGELTSQTLDFHLRDWCRNQKLCGVLNRTKCQFRHNVALFKVP